MVKTNEGTIELSWTSLIACVTEHVLLVNSLLCGVINLPYQVAFPTPVHSLRLSIIYFPSPTGTRESRSNTTFHFMPTYSITEGHKGGNLHSDVLAFAHNHTFNLSKKVVQSIGKICRCSYKACCGSAHIEQSTYCILLKHTLCTSNLHECGVFFRSWISNTLPREGASSAGGC